MNLSSLTRASVVRLIAVTLACGPLVQAAPAFSQDRTITSADIPFEFRLGADSLPAGKYNFVRVNEHILAVRSVSGSKSHNVMIFQGQPPQGTDSKLLFHHVGSHYFLADLKLANSTGFHIPKTRAENEAVIAANTSIATPDTVVALNATGPR